MKTIQAWNREQVKLQDYPLKAKTSDTYFGKSYMDYYHFCQQCKDYFKTSCAIRINHTSFAATFFYSTINLKWVQHKCRYKSDTPITWTNFKIFLQKNLGDSQAFNNSTWSKFKRDSQYHLEEAQEYASQLQYLQSILVEFDIIRAFTKPTIICYFQKSLKLSIKVEMK